MNVVAQKSRPRGVACVNCEGRKMQGEVGGACKRLDSSHIYPSVLDQEVGLATWRCTHTHTRSMVFMWISKSFSPFTPEIIIFPSPTLPFLCCVLLYFT